MVEAAINSVNLDIDELHLMLNDLAKDNWAISQTLFKKEYCINLANESLLLQEQGYFGKAAIGTNVSKVIESKIRGDFTFWIQNAEPKSYFFGFKLVLQKLMEELNENFYLCLKHYEAHFAIYPKGTGYKKHFDNQFGEDSRQITFILYLNDGWKIGDGGELCIYHQERHNELLVKINPSILSFILFRSDYFPHEVENALKQRISMTGWFRNDMPFSNGIT